jgi:hypothetical protein
MKSGMNGSRTLNPRKARGAKRILPCEPALRRERRDAPALPRFAAVLLAVVAGTVGAAETDSAADPACVNVQLAPGVGFDCLNERLARQVRRQADRRALLAITEQPLSSATPSELGLYTQAATRQRLGNAFGHSVYPQRPVSQYHDPLLSGHRP